MVVEIIVAFAGGDPVLIPHDDWYTTARDSVWSDRGVRLVSVLLLLIGLVLLVLQLLRRRPLALALERTHDTVEAEVSRSSLEQTAARVARREDGVTRAHVRVGLRKAHVVVTTPLQENDDLQRRVNEAVRGKLDRMGLAHPLSVSCSFNRVGKR